MDVTLFAIIAFAALVFFLGFITGFCAGWRDAEKQYGYKLPL